jgi:hypothetical protein
MPNHTLSPAKFWLRKLISIYKKMCKAVSSKILDEGYGSEKMAGYTNHYDVRLNKCFMRTTMTQVDSKTKQIGTFETLEDTYEGKVYGTYTWFTREGKK